jgi:hypothetical protein
VKKTILAIAAMISITTGVYAQEVARTSLHIWTDQFGSSGGVVIYPQYSWSVKVPTGCIGGYGFVETAPHEELFTNNLAIYTPAHAPWYSVHTETGGNPNAGTSFFQLGPRVNVVNSIPWLKRPMDHLFFAALPRFKGVRPNNLLIAGATNSFAVTKTLQGSVEGYNRFLTQGAYYGEYWFLVRNKRTPHTSLGLFILNDSAKRVIVGFGGRISLF